MSNSGETSNAWSFEKDEHPMVILGFALEVLEPIFAILKEEDKLSVSNAIEFRDHLLALGYVIVPKLEQANKVLMNKLEPTSPDIPLLDDSTNYLHQLNERHRPRLLKILEDSKKYPSFDDIRAYKERMREKP